jgi:small-conductance mechanosensitive channel
MPLHQLYILVVGVLLLLAVWPVLRALQKIQEQHGESLKKRKKHGAIPAQLRRKPIQEQQIQRMESHISITRRTLLVLFLISGICLAAIPYMASTAPAVLPVILAAFSVIMGIAAKPIIENITCGLVLSFGKLARIGDTVLIDNEYGVIEDLTLTHCIVRRWDSLRYVVPNSSMMTKEFVNYSLNDNHRWVHVEFWVDYNADLQLVEQLAKEAPLGSPYYSDRDTPRFWVAETERDAIKCMVVAWATWPSDGWGLALDIRKALVKKLQEHHITTHTHRVHMDAASL